MKRAQNRSEVEFEQNCRIRESGNPAPTSSFPSRIQLSKNLKITQITGLPAEAQYFFFSSDRSEF